MIDWLALKEILSLLVHMHSGTIPPAADSAGLLLLAGDLGKQMDNRHCCMQGKTYLVNEYYPVRRARCAGIKSADGRGALSDGERHA